MAKSDKPIEDIKLHRAFDGPRQPPWLEDKPINGFDTETADGMIFALSVAWEGFGGLVEASKDGLDNKTLWDYLTHSRARSSLNMWYNLNFDANVILSHILDEKDLAELTVSGNVEVGNKKITFIPGKFLKIRVGGDKRQTYTHYDASQFFFGSLDDASKEWLNKEKLQGPNTKKFGKENGQVNSYIEERWGKIEKYAVKDAELVRDLWIEAGNVGEGLGIPMGMPFSTGYLGESFLNSYLKEKPGLGPRETYIQGWDAYAGGRFEVLKRGNIGPVAGPDINSAYPYILSNLPDPKTLTWERLDNPSISDLQEADYGFVTATVTTDSERPIQPFAVKHNDKLIYPALKDYQITTIKDVFVNAWEYNYLENWNVSEAWVAFENNSTRYPFDFIQSLYNKRKSLEKDGDIKKAQLLKIILNSMYGKMCQTTPKRQKVEGATQLEEMEEFIPSLSLPPHLREKYENGFIEWLQAGSWFNPTIASHITGLTRLELHKRILEYGLEYDTVMLATDSLMIEQKPFEKSGFADDLVKSGLGNWDYDYRGKAYVVGAGVYQVDLQECKVKDCPGHGGYSDHCKALGHTRKVQTRGFKEADLAGGLRYASKNADGPIDIESTRPKTVAEAIWRNQEVSDVGKFLDQNRDLTPSMDENRNWDRTPTFGTLLDETEASKPKVLSG